MPKIHLTEEQIKYINECKRFLITESSRDNLLLPYLEIIKKREPNATLGQLKNFLMKKFVTEGNIHALSLGSNFYLAGVARYYFNGDLTSNKRLNIFYPNISDKFIPEVCQRLDEIIVLLRNSYIDSVGTKFEQPEDFGTLSIDKLFKKYGGRIDKEKLKKQTREDEKQLALDKYKNASSKVGNRNYTYDIMYSHEDCKKYNQATSPGAWCITYAQMHYNAYTKKTAHFVIFAKSGYENIPRKVTKGFPLDEYGLSLLAVRQSNSDGSFIGCTTRWNHGGHGGAPNVSNADYALNYEQFKSITGISDDEFNNIFEQWKTLNSSKSNTVDRSAINAKKTEIKRRFKYIQMLLQNGMTLKQLHDDNYIQGGKLLYPFSSDYNLNTIKIGKTILSLDINDDEGTNTTIFDRGNTLADEIVCKKITTASFSYQFFNSRDNEHTKEFAICELDNDKIMFYMYKQHNLLSAEGNKYWKTFDFTSNKDYCIFKGINGSCLFDFIHQQIVTAPNGYSLFESIKDYGTNEGCIVELLRDSASGETYYLNLTTGKFVDFGNYFMTTLCRSDVLYKIFGQPIIAVAEKRIGDSYGYNYRTGYKYKLYNLSTDEFISLPDIGDTFEKLETISDTPYLRVNKCFWDGVKQDILKYPNGEPVIAENYNYKNENCYFGREGKHLWFNVIVFTINYGERKYSLLDLKTNKFYINEDGSYIFTYYGSNKVYDKNGGLMELPSTADGEYWYSTKKTDNNEVEKLLSEGVDINDIFDNINELYSDENIKCVNLNNLFNFIVNNGDSTYHLLTSVWFDDVKFDGEFFNNLACVKNIGGGDSQWLFLNKNGENEFGRTFGNIGKFSNTTNCAIVKGKNYSLPSILKRNGEFIKNPEQKGTNLENNFFDIEPAPGKYLYFLVKTNKRMRNFRYLSLAGNLFGTPDDAHKDSIENGFGSEKQESLNESKKNKDFFKKTRISLGYEPEGDYMHVIDSCINEEYEKDSIQSFSFGELDEMIDSDEMGDVLNSFEVQKQLNPKIWVNNKLNSRVRLRLLDIADKFFDSLGVDWVKTHDIIMTGSLCNYNWSKYSDIDLHILVDFKDVDERTHFVKDYFDSKKRLWNQEHDNLKIYGYPVELYVQDINEEHTASGIYSLEKNEWIKEPERDEMKAIQLDKEKVLDKVENIVSIIDNFEKQIEKEQDTEKIDIISDKVKKLFDKIKGVRRESLKKKGEMGIGNIVFKTLRRLDYIGKLVELKNKTWDKIFSIK